MGKKYTTNDTKKDGTMAQLNRFTSLGTREWNETQPFA